MIRTKLISLIVIALSASVFLRSADSATDKSAWQIVCLSKKAPCYMAANIKTLKGAVVSIFTIEKKRRKGTYSTYILATLQVPLGYHVPSGIKVRLDDKNIIHAKLIECNAKGCKAIFALKPGHLKTLQRGEKISIQLKDAKSRKNINLHYSLKGFSKTWKNYAQSNR